jgi:hypothetical protein
VDISSCDRRKSVLRDFCRWKKDLTPDESHQQRNESTGVQDSPDNVKTKDSLVKSKSERILGRRREVGKEDDEKGRGVNGTT